MGEQLGSIIYPSSEMDEGTMRLSSITYNSRTTRKNYESLNSLSSEEETFSAAVTVTTADASVATATTHNEDKMVCTIYYASVS